MFNVKKAVIFCLFAAIAIVLNTGYMPKAFAANEAVITLASGSGSPGSAVALNLSINTSAVLTNVSGVQWDFLYSSSDISAVSVTDGPVSTAAGKSATCNLFSTGDYRCIVFGFNQNIIASGVLSVVTFTLTNSPAGSVPIQFSGLVATDSNGSPVGLLGNGGSISVSAAVTPTPTPTPSQTVNPNPGVSATPTPTPTPTAANLIPPPVTNTAASASGNNVLLVWNNPPAGNGWVNNIIIRKSGSVPPSSLTDGTQVYSGIGTNYTDSGLVNGSVYSYSIFALNASGNYSGLASVQATIGSGKTNAGQTTQGSGGSGSSSGASTPVSTGSGMYLINDSGTFYLVSDGSRHGVTNPGMLFSYGFEFKDALLATASDKALPQGNLLLPGNGALVKSPVDPTVFLISGNQKHGFTSAAVFLALGFKFSSVLLVTAPELNQQSVGEIISDPKSRHLDGLDINDQGTIYWLSGGTRFPYPSQDVYNSWHLDNDFSRVVPANDADRALPVGGVSAKRILSR